MGEIVQFMVDSGVNETTIALLLMLPVVATIVGIARHYLGIKSFGIFTPVMLSFAYASISDDFISNIIYGLLITFFTIVASVLMQYLLDVNRSKVFRMHYLPKLAIIMTSVAVGLLLVLFVGSFLNRSFVSMEPLPLLLIVTLVESFVAKSFRKGIKSAVGITAETVSLSLIGYFIITYQPFRELILENPLLVLITLPVNYIVGKYTGLRLTEWFRFTDIDQNA